MMPVREGHIRRNRWCARNVLTGMLNHARSLAIAAALVAPTVTAGPASALPLMASCERPSAQEALARAAAVVFGTVVGTRPADARFGLRSGGEIEFRVDRTYKGIDAGRTIAVGVAPDGVGYWTAEVGTQHTLYLRVREEWPPWPTHAPTAALYTSLCFGSHEGSPTAEELVVLGPGQRGVDTSAPPATLATPIPEHLPPTASPMAERRDVLGAAVLVLAAAIGLLILAARRRRAT